jgi:TIR domain
MPPSVCALQRLRRASHPSSSHGQAQSLARGIREQAFPSRLYEAVLTGVAFWSCKVERNQMSVLGEMKPLTASQRVSYLKEIGERLDAEEWSLIDVTLSQFELPTNNVWSGTKAAYVMEMAKHASDSVLTELAQHVGYIIEEAPKPGIDPRFWRTRMFRLFVSHLASERKFAGQLQEALLPYGISAFVAHNDIEPTLEWQSQIEAALATADSLVALLHPKFHVSKWTDQEIGFAMGRGLPVFAMRFGQDPYGFIGRFQAFTGGEKTPIELAQELFDAYRKNKQTQKRMAEVLVTLFEESTSFAGSKARIGYLEELEVWDASFVPRIKAALKSNSQISDSWGVPDRVKVLAKKWAGS